MSNKVHTPASDRYHVAISILAQFLRLGAPLIYYPILAHSFGSEVFASFATALALSQIAGNIIEFGMGTSAVRQITQKLEEPAAVLANVVYGRLLIFVALVSLYLGWSLAGPQNEANTASTGITILLAFGLGFTPVWYYSAKNRVPLLAATEVLTALGQLIGVVLFVRGPDDLHVALICIAAPPTAHILIAHAAAHVEFGVVRPTFQKIWANYQDSFSFFQINIVQSNIAPLLILAISAVSSPSNVSFYALAERLYGATSGLSYPVIRVLFPRISGMIGTNLEGAIKLFANSTLIYFVVTFAGCTFVALTSSLTVPLVFGSDFSASWPTVAALLMAAPMAGLSRMVGMLALVPTGLEASYRQITVISGMALLVASLPIASLLGSMGLATAKLIFDLVIAGALIAVLGRKSPRWLKGHT